jgi:hypothetical protein
MAVFFNGTFLRELRRETERHFRRETADRGVRSIAHAITGSLSPRNSFAGLGTRRVLSGRGRTQALRSPLSQQTGTSKTQYSSPGNQSKSSVGRGRNAQKGPTTGTSGTAGTRAATSGTTGTRGTSPTNFQRVSARKAARNHGKKYTQS